MAKQVVRIGRLYIESVGMDLHVLALDFNEKDSLVHGVELSLQPKQIFELIEALERHVSKLVREKACATCVNFKDGCSLSAMERVQCNNNSKSQYIPAMPTRPEV